MRKVLVDLNRLRENPYNGLYQFSKDLGQGLAAITDKELELDFYLPSNKFGFFGNNVNYVPHYSRDKYYMRGTGKYDVWHITTQISWYRPFNNRTKSVFTIHDLNFLIEEKDNVKRNKRLLADIQKRVDRSHYITAISNYALQVVEQHLDLHDLPRRVVYNGCAMESFPLFNAPKYKPSKPFLFSIGSVQPRKNFHALMPLLLNNDYELIIAGQNHFDYAATVQAAAEKYNVANRVKMIGAVSDEEKYWYYNNCMAFVFPSIAEGFGFPAIEAMILGKPVFLSVEACLPEIGGDAAYYFKHFDDSHMQQVFKEGMHHYETTKPQEHIKQRAALFSWHNTARDYMDIYKQV